MNTESENTFSKHPYTKKALSALHRISVNVYIMQAWISVDIVEYFMRKCATPIIRIVISNKLEYNTLQNRSKHPASWILHLRSSTFP